MSHWGDVGGHYVFRSFQDVDIIIDRFGCVYVCVCLGDFRTHEYTQTHMLSYSAIHMCVNSIAMPGQMLMFHTISWNDKAITCSKFIDAIITFNEIELLFSVVLPGCEDAKTKSQL